MAYSVPRSGLGDVSPPLPGASDLDAATAAIDAARGQLARCREQLVNSGAALAAAYVEGAADALGHAFNASCRAQRQGRKGDLQVRLPLGTGVVRLKPARKGLATAEVEREIIPRREGVSIGGSLASHGATMDLLCGDVTAAGLMAAALGQYDWLHLRSDQVSYGDPLAGAAIIATLVRHTGFPRWSRLEMRGLLDQRSHDLLRELGWVRLQGPQLPTA